MRILSIIEPIKDPEIVFLVKQRILEFIFLIFFPGPPDSISSKMQPN